MSESEMENKSTGAGKTAPTRTQIGADVTDFVRSPGHDTGHVY